MIEKRNVQYEKEINPADYRQLKKVIRGFNQSGGSPRGDCNVAGRVLWKSNVGGSLWPWNPSQEHWKGACDEKGKGLG